MDPITRDKIRFNPDLTEFAPAEHLDSEFGGKYKLKFDHPTYWDTLTTYVLLKSRPDVADQPDSAILYAS
jgi:hypothetical protein